MFFEQSSKTTTPYSASWIGEHQHVLRDMFSSPCFIEKNSPLAHRAIQHVDNLGNPSLLVISNDNLEKNREGLCFDVIGSFKMIDNKITYHQSSDNNPTVAKIFKLHSKNEEKFLSEAKITQAQTCLESSSVIVKDADSNKIGVILMHKLPGNSVVDAVKNINCDAVRDNLSIAINITISITEAYLELIANGIKQHDPNLGNIIIDCSVTPFESHFIDFGIAELTEPNLHVSNHMGNFQILLSRIKSELFSDFSFIASDINNNLQIIEKYKDTNTGLARLRIKKAKQAIDDMKNILGDFPFESYNEFMDVYNSTQGNNTDINEFMEALQKLQATLSQPHHVACKQMFR